MDPETEISSPVRISCIGGRYLIFDHRDILRLRRQRNLCAILVGTTPQNPSQNIFQGVPLEIGPEEATVLVDVNDAYIVDEFEAHMNALTGDNQTSHLHYLDNLKSCRQRYSEALGAEEKRKIQESRAYHTSDSEYKNEVGSNSKARTPNYQTALTPTHSLGLISGSVALSRHKRKIDPSWQWLQSHFYFMTPGLRFGSHYSVYPGDPLRYHAHFLANSYVWNKPVPLLNLVGNGRLGTAVKKGYLIGSQPLDEQDKKVGSFRAFTVEWAAM